MLHGRMQRGWGTGPWHHTSLNKVGAPLKNLPTETFSILNRSKLHIFRMIKVNFTKNIQLKCFYLQTPGLIARDYSPLLNFFSKKGN